MSCMREAYSHIEPGSGFLGINKQTYHYKLLEKVACSKPHFFFCK